MTGAGLIRRLAACRDALAVVEFALVLPLLLTLYVGGYVVTDMITCNRKVTIATRELTDIATRYPELTASQAQAILAASQQVLAPYNFQNATAILSEVQVVDATHVKVVWSEAIANGQTVTSTRQPNDSITVPSGLIPSSLIPSDSSQGNYCSLNATSGTGTQAGCMMLGEVSYAYTPAITYSNFTSMNLYDDIYMFPRVSSGIPQI